MKWIGLFFTSLVFQSSTALIHRSRHHSTPPSLQRALSISRGGDLGSLSGKTLAQTLAALASCDALAGALAPRTSMAWCGVDIDGGSLSEHYLHGLAASAATTAVSTYLATSGKTSVEEAIGYGFIARLLSMLSMVLFSEQKELGMTNPMFLFAAILISTTTYCLFSGKGDATALTKLVSLLLFIHGSFLYVNPVAFVERAPLVADPTSIAMASISGGYMAVSAIVTGLLANGVDPVKVAGYASLSFLPVIVKLFDVIAIESFLGISTGFWLAAISALLAAIATGTVFD